MTVFTGPLFAPFVGGFIVESYLGWRWTEYLTGITGTSAFALDLFFLEETYLPVVLIGKAAELHLRTKNWGIHAKQEEIEVELGELIRKNFSRPLRILFTEPIVLLRGIYMAFLYGLLYLFMIVYPIVFQQIYGFGKGVGSLPYIGMIIGEFLGGIFIILLQPWYNKKLDANNDIPPDSAASALAANSVLRSAAGAGFPLFAPSMFNAFGVNWTGTLPGCVAALMMPMPLLFYLYGHKIRAKNKFTMEYLPAVQAHNDKHAD
ncbi:uncharacterized protein ACLA_045350 [Aspergillus clavatus NRRL 1]|uniref:MFS multidrug transporter n=1 Tax=Aspergillus clavatus (strain ATCC 1007 / CBS 513.65 / DSM 816 / NCTC 3887 / NRRL 1 / QM 1276 / 107) TaxID=344612 RepID=A1CGR5_ASPCL|nr:uncharacterized protein ACLA_045350 [Aspergillus clavatus NRRL 1]EAW10070.1 conserved hypothetical protein [Aspergillus clavatus NRRL 1]